MKFVAIFLLIAVVGFCFYKLSLNDPPLRGLIQDASGQMVLASRARPVVIFEPNPKFTLALSGWKTVRAEDRRLDGEGVRVSLAIYDNAQAQLVTALAETSGELEWEAAHHCPYKTLRETEEPYGKERRYQSVFVLDEKNDPFERGLTKVLVVRSKFLLFFRKMQVIAEYHEPLSNEQARIIDLDPKYIRSFLERAEAACQVRFQANQDELANPEKLSPAGNSISRTKLAKWLGEIHHPGHGR